MSEGLVAGRRAGDAGDDVADIAPAPARLGDLGVVEEALRLVVGVAVDEGGAFLLGEGHLHLGAIHWSMSTTASSSSVGSPPAWRRAPSSETRVRPASACRSAAAQRSPPPSRSPDRCGERLLQHRRRHLPHRRWSGSARRRQPPADLGLGLRRHQIAAVLAGAIRHRLGVERRISRSRRSAHRPRRPPCARSAAPSAASPPSAGRAASATAGRACASARRAHGDAVDLLVVTTSAESRVSISPGAGRWPP